jgi:hypothetical protein
VILYLDMGGLESRDMNFEFDKDGTFPFYVACANG